MPDIPVGSQIFDVVFHPTSSIVYTGLLTGEVKAFGYDEQGQYDAKFSVKPGKGSCRGLALGEDGSQLWAVGKGKGLHTVDTATGEVTNSRIGAHDTAINRVKRAMSHLIATGDDDGVIKLWDPRKKDSVRTYTQHFDFISDFLWLEDKKQLVATSGDGTLSVMDVRSKKTEPFAHSEDQEDELLSIVTIKGGTKAVVGTQLGILSIFNRKKGWGDCVDRVTGHPHSIDALCALPSYYPSSQSTILTGSSDGLLRAVQLLPTKLLGVVADHGDFPIERIAVDRAGEDRWVGSVGHDEVLRLTDLREVFEDEDGEGDAVAESKADERDQSEEEEEEGEDEEAENADEVPELQSGNGVLKRGKDEDSDAQENEGAAQENEGAAQEDDSGAEDSDEPKPKKKRKKEKDPLKAERKKKGKNEMASDASFFSGL